MTVTRAAQANPLKGIEPAALGDGAARLPLIESLDPVEALDAAFALHPQLSTLVLEDAWRDRPHWQMLCEFFGAPRIPRAGFYQSPWHWLHHDRPATRFNIELGRVERPLNPEGRVYERFDPRLERCLTLRTVSLDDDLDRLVRWMNNPRVAHFWEQARPREELAEWFAHRLAQPHRLGLIGEFDGEPFGYFELYWAAEDVIAPYYVWQGFDRGLHVLVGEEDFRGASFVNAWLGGLQHYAYLAEPRTDRLVLEPAASNERLFRHLERLGLFRQREFDLPDKRAALVMGWRSQFFGEVM
ncbi:GNAT family N-acetyltransferase [Kushneria phosphatilytica]|uniref:Acetyltransferase n=1 Tax=Kushneria phosphatilytica TaxID=657387 RepID=A0A1S1NLK2_9GAMM|nr:GNAT family N-acetyltransferase [Kushneria phosphatilytica]OHV07646.1 hypothetical protein BH688_15705 [Kushneria phosphatilytica]QEL10136.1 acetyltransferase [Kushneria phosphatilytica]